MVDTSLVEAGPQERDSRPPDDRERFIVIQTADVLHDDDRVRFPW